MYQDYGTWEYVQPDPSSQTTTRWPLVMSEYTPSESEGAALNTNVAAFGAPMEKSFADAMEYILRKRAATWKKLAEL